MKKELEFTCIYVTRDGIEITEEEFIKRVHERHARLAKEAGKESKSA